MWKLDDWHDLIRVALGLVSLGCIFLLGTRFRQNSWKWNTKTRDYWFALVMWSIAAVVLAIEGVLRDSDFGARLVFCTIAASVTLKGLASRSSWGES